MRCMRQQDGTPSIWPTLLSATSCEIMAQGQPAQQDLPAALLSQTAAVTPYRTGLEARATVDGRLQLGPSVEASQRSCCGCFARSFFRLSAVLNALTCAWSEKELLLRSSVAVWGQGRGLVRISANHRLRSTDFPPNLRFCRSNFRQIYDFIG